MNVKAATWMTTLVLFSGTALADGAGENSGAYFGGGLSLTKIEDNEAGISYSDQTVGWRLLGGYQFNRHFAFEGGYANLGEATDNILSTPVTAEFSGFFASAVGIVPATERFHVFGKIGLYSGDTDVTVAGLTVSDSDSGLMLGGGLSYRVNPHWMIRGDFDWYDVDFDTMWSFGGGVTYNFR